VTTTTNPNETPSPELTTPARNQAARDLLAHFEKTEGVALTVQWAKLILAELERLRPVAPSR
jgi:hypothetical protein